MKSNIQVDRRIRKTREALRAALQKLLLDKAFDQITIRDIADEADIAYTTFFRHHADKDSLLSDLADAEISALLDLTLPLFAPDDSLRSTLAMCKHVQTKGKLWTALLTGGAAGTIRMQFIDQTAARFDQWPAVSHWMPPELSVAVLCGVTLDVLTWWMGKAPQTPVEDVADILDKFFVLATD